MRRSLSLSTLALLPLLILAAPAAADDRWTAPGNVYVELEGGSEWVNVPEVTAISQGGESFGSIDDDFHRWSTGLAIGIADPEGLMLPDPIGRNARIEGRVRYALGKSDAGVRTGVASVIQPDGVGGLAQAGTVDVLFNTELETWDADLTYQTDVVVNDWLAISPLVGVRYTRMQFDNDHKVVNIGAPPAIETSDFTRTHYYGGVLGVDFAVRPVDALELSLGLRGDLMGATASMNVRQDTFTVATNRESDNDTNFAAEATATAGITWRLGPLGLGVEGFARYLSYFATPDHPQFSGDRAANIDGEDLWSAGARASLTIWFP